MEILHPIITHPLSQVVLTVSNRRVRPLSQRLILFSRLHEDRQVRIGIFPECKEILIRLARARRVAAEDRGAAQAEIG